ncbi:sugar O-acyltransferase [Tenacibaculum finnmarkense]|uniref:NeuD/PglB/VioB family sugar acetyltransferase n=1 Tax=Tenacibaculum TaxID=104267 RepID=UPI00187B5550|nr:MULTISPECIES: NeuD/PglB/VioB family sugar acetyltransferase [Tenacibaculum]MBE7648467.1 sugar O-acyltransferase [Tenacibaculum finnmarkense genomovar ulcerans]MCD8400512.1 NeuD/PglB/VioB family sugar acetyltransferase [Tenacibaculum finnmarkense genomovar ulcerans]MCD8432707.1 NeuD/PglB/VioB family sugar acetyltransferase [Tenacibaculum finnmarkense genomovar ulcerans]MCG8236943.1 NeuD/PglB/VioB family sugar acetyltransferase [Tenacibaculum finnmarkense genomovar ulcerans]MCG8749743.1 sugar
MEDTQYNKTLAIVGAGGFGREMESWVFQSDLIEKYNVIGYLDDNPSSLDNFESDLKIIDTISLASLQKAKNVLVAISNKEVKKRIFDYYINNGGFNIINFFHASSLRGKFSKLGLGFIATPNVIISCNTIIGDGVFVNSGSQIGHDVKIGNYVSIMANVDIGGGAIIGDNVFIGSGATILPGVKISANIKVGAGAIVLRNLKKEGTYFGNPAKKIF